MANSLQFLKINRNINYKIEINILNLSQHLPKRIKDNLLSTGDVF